MKNLHLSTWMLGLALLMASGCSSEDNPGIPEPTPEPVPGQISISLDCGIANIANKATDAAFETGDRIGLYVVNYNGDTAGSLQSARNHVDNMPFTYGNGVWTGSNLKDVATYPVEVKADQSLEANYKASDFMWGKTGKAYPTEKAVNITLSHLFSCAVVELVAGSGFTDNDLAASDVQVQLNNACRQATVNLANGTVTPTSGTGSISFLRTEGNKFKALVIPQSIPASSNFITVTLGGKTYSMEKSFTFVGGHRYQFTLTVRKTSNGINVDINDWVDDDVDNGGVAE